MRTQSRQKAGLNRRLFTVRLRPEYIRLIQRTARRERVSQGLVIERGMEIVGKDLTFPIKRHFGTPV